MFNTPTHAGIVAKLNFSVPEDVKAAFDDAFRGENRSRILSELMREAVEAKQRAQRRVTAIDPLLVLRAQAPRVAATERDAARLHLRGEDA